MFIGFRLWCKLWRDGRPPILLIAILICLLCLIVMIIFMIQYHIRYNERNINRTLNKIPHNILHWRFHSLQRNSRQIHNILVSYRQIHCKLLRAQLDAANSCRWSRSIRRIPGRSSLGSSSGYWKLWTLLVSVTVCSTQVATFFLLSNLGLAHSILDTTRLPSAYAPLHS